MAVKTNTFSYHGQIKFSIRVIHASPAGQLGHEEAGGLAAAEVDNNHLEDDAGMARADSQLDD